ncbi:unnamed protein product, partial [marine sediment metagenome]
MVKCAECGQIFGSTQALSSHVRNVHGVGPKTEDQVESDNGILDLKKEVKRAELSARLQRLRSSMEGGKLDLLFLELDRLGRELEHSKKLNETLRARVSELESQAPSLDSTKRLVGSSITMIGDLHRSVNELIKLTGQSMVLEGWRLSTDCFGVYDLQGLSDNRLRYLVKEGKIVLGNPQPVPYGSY